MYGNNLRYLLLVLLFTSNPLLSQSWYLKRSISWNVQDAASVQDASVQDLTDFRFAVFEDHPRSLPLFSEVIELNFENRDVAVKFFSEEYEPLPDDFTTDELFASLNDHIDIRHTIAFERRKPFLQVSFHPFRKNSSTGKIERLREFILEIESAQEQIPYRTARKSTEIQNSVLSEGEWFKIRIPSTGIYKLTFEQLRAIGLSDPSSVRVFGYGGHALPEDVREGTKNDLVPLNIFMDKGSDQVFNQGDYILFYGTAVNKWYYDNENQMFRCRKNPYSDYGYYFLTSNKGIPDEPVTLEIPGGEVAFNINTYDYRGHHELHLRNLIKSGRKWYGEEFDVVIQHTVNFSIQGLVTSEPLSVLTNVLSRAKDSATFILNANGNDVETFRIRSTSLSDYTAVHAYNQQKKTLFYSTSDNISLRLRYVKPDPSARGWLDFITLNARARLVMNSDQLLMRDKSSVLSGAITRFTVANADDRVIVWDVTDPGNILNISYTLQSGNLSFLTETSSLREFAVFRKNGSFPSPEFSGKGLGKIENQNLHGIDVPDLVIITHENFKDQVERFASYREEKNNIKVYVTTPEKIYNEFSSGTPDVTAIRNFLMMLYERSEPENGLKNLLLFGDGSYDNKGISANPGNILPTYQSENSLSPVLSYLTDDYFAMLDPGEQMLNGLLDIGVGRLPVSTTAQAEIMINKIQEYEDPSNMGSWRNSICFIGDDEDNNLYMHQANQLAEYVSIINPSLNINKIFLDAYKQVTTPLGQRYPDVNRAINEQVTRGALIVNYTGHGGNDGLAHEKILTMNDISSWKNRGRYPLFLTATCDFSRFDDFERITAGEEAILNPAGGGIALLTTTRLVYSGPNHTLNERFYEVVFEKDENNRHSCLGTIMRSTKNRTGSGINKRNFTLLGDPSMRLAYPEFKIITDSINEKPVGGPVDTLKAFSFVTISGHIEDQAGNIMNDMNGVVYSMIYDKPVQLKTLANDGGATMDFTLQNNILYNGKAGLSGGYFKFSFIVPKDINYSHGRGRFSFYAHDSLKDASGAFTNLIIGGTAENYTIDKQGPLVNVYLNNTNFKHGDITDPNPVLYIRVEDESGINTTGNGVGHDITATLNDQTGNVMVLNEYFLADVDSYKGGTIIYPMFNLDEGRHTISVKVWDIHNNSGEGSLEFVVVNSKDFLLNEIFNFPNPFKEETWFSFGHNSAGDDLDITIDIFDTSGGLIKTLKAKEFGSGFRSEPVRWDGTNEAGNNNRQGTYIYRIRVINSRGQQAEKSGRLMMVR